MAETMERPEFYQRIDAALARRTKLANAIEAFADESKSRQIGKDVRELLVALRGDATTEQFVREGSKAVWLPLVLRGFAADGANEDFKQILSDVTFAEENRRSQWRTFAYPLVIFGSGILVFVFLSITVLPTFEKMFREFELKLPFATRSVIAMSHPIREQPLLTCFWILAVLVVAWGLRRLFHWILRQTESNWFLGSLTTGSTGNVKAMARFTSTLAELLNIGAPLQEAILIAGRSSQSTQFRHASTVISRDIGTSDKFSYDSAVAHNFPSLVVQALESGPNGGPSIALLRHVSAIYFNRVRLRFSWSEGFLAPLSIVGIGLCIGYVVIALFMPLISLVTSLSGPGS